MPFYEYECSSCGKQTELLQKISDAPARKCPHCGKSAMKRLISAPVFRLKGSGWYETDFKSDQDRKRNLAGSEDSSDSGSADAKSDTKAETKADSKDTKAADAKPAEKPAEKSGSVDAKKTASKSASKSSAKSKPKPAAKKKSGKR